MTAKHIKLTPQAEALFKEQADKAKPVPRKPDGTIDHEQLRAEAELVWPGPGRPAAGDDRAHSSAKSVRMPDLIWEALEAEARREGVTRNALIVRLLARDLQQR